MRMWVNGLDDSFAGRVAAARILDLRTATRDRRGSDPSPATHQGHQMESIFNIMILRAFFRIALQ